MQTIFINRYERSSVLKMSQESYRKKVVTAVVSQQWMVENQRWLLSLLAITLNCRGIKNDCNQLSKRPDVSSNVENGKMKWCLYHQNNSHSNKNCYQPQPDSANLDNKKIWCTHHSSASHSNDECFHERGSKFENSSSADGKNSGKKSPFIADNAPTGCDAKVCCKCKVENISYRSNDKSYSPLPDMGFSFVMCHLPL